jgi:cell division protein FtsW (lipid II flippase)
VAGSWVVVILMLWPELAAAIVILVASIAFLVRGGRGWFYLAVGGAAVAVVTVVLYIMFNRWKRAQSMSLCQIGARS